MKKSILLLSLVLIFKATYAQQYPKGYDGKILKVDTLIEKNGNYSVLYRDSIEFPNGKKLVSVMDGYYNSKGMLLAERGFYKHIDYVYYIGYHKNGKISSATYSFNEKTVEYRYDLNGTLREVYESIRPKKYDEYILHGYCFFYNEKGILERIEYYQNGEKQECNDCGVSSN